MPDIEEHIQKAYAEGKFDNLPGNGKPLRLADDSMTDPEWRMAFHVLKASGYSLPWIEKRREILEDWENAITALCRSYAWRQAAINENVAQARVEEEWSRAQESFRSQVVQLNKRIFSYNLEIPSPQFALVTKDAEKELIYINEQGC
jgi:DnaJ family protein C protein 28